MFWNSCSRRWARLECGNRLRTRTFMETCWWSRRRRRRQPEGSQRPERQRQRPERPDPRPHPGAGRAQPLRAQRGHSLVAGSWRVRGVGERGAGAGAAGPEVSGPPRGRGPQGDAPRSRLPAGLQPTGAARPAGAAGWLPGSALWPREPASGSGGRLLALRPCFQPRSCRVGRVAFGSFPHSCREEPSASGVGAVPSLYPWGPSRYKVQCRPPTHHVPPARSPSPPAMPAVFKRNHSWSVPAEAGE